MKMRKVSSRKRVRKIKKRKRLRIMKKKLRKKRKSQLAKENNNVVVNPLTKDLPYPHALTRKGNMQGFWKFSKY